MNSKYSQEWNNLSLDDLQLKLDETVHENENLLRENELFDSYLKRSTQLSAVTEADDKRDKNGKTHTRRLKVQPALSIDQKNEIAFSELEAIQREIEETKSSSDRLVDTLKAVLEETDIRITELKKDTYEFKRDIVVGAENFRTGKIMAEKIIRYMEEKLRQKDASIEKLRLKNASLKLQAQKVDAQLRQKEVMGDVLHYIDFHQLQIENKQYVAKIEERNNELLQLKMTTGHTIQILNNLKSSLNKVMEESNELNRNIKEKMEAASKLQDEYLLTQEDIEKEKKMTKKLQGRQSGEMPQILDYVSQKAKMYDIQQEIKNMERKIEIAEMEYKMKQRGLRKVKSKI